MIEAALGRGGFLGCRVPRVMCVVMVVLGVMRAVRTIALPRLLRKLFQPRDRKRRRTQLQRERLSGRGHEARWNQRAQQERDEHEADEASAFGSAENRGAH